MWHDIKLHGGAFVTCSFVAQLPVLFLVQFIAIRHCFSVSAFICESTMLHLRIPNRLASIGQVHDAFITKKYDTLYNAFFSPIFFEGNCEESLRSSEQHPMYTICQTQSDPAANRIRHARSTIRARTARPSSC